MSQLDYVPAPGFFDELFEGPGVPRPPASALTDVLPGADTVTPLLRPVQQELERLDAEIHYRFFDPSTVVTQTVTG